MSDKKRSNADGVLLIGILIVTNRPNISLNSCGNYIPENLGPE
jgi:hypothetical protein